jgi:hypothetical protein
MTSVDISGWQKACNAVAAIKEIRTRASVPLNEALALVNRVLANEKVPLAVPYRADALQVVEELERVGMICKVIEGSFASSANPALSDRPLEEDVALVVGSKNS